MRALMIAFLLHISWMAIGQCPASDFLVHGQSSSLEACPNQVLDLNNQSANAVSYEWDFCAGDMDGIPSGTLVSTLTSVQSYDALKIVKESDTQYYGFILKLSSGGLFRLNFGADLSQSPTPESLGALGLGGASDMEFINDQGTWYALVASGSNLFRLKFTAGLGGIAATITSVNLGNFGGLLSNTRGLSLVKQGPDYYALATSSTLNTVTTIRFAGSMEGSTSTSSIAVPGSSSLLAINLFRECDTWYGLMTSAGNNKLIKVQFGTDLLNTGSFQFLTQSGVAIQSFGMDMLVENGKYYVFLATIGSPATFFQLDFGSSIWTNNPVVINHGSQSGLAACIAMDFLLKDSQVIGFIGNRSNFQLHRINYPNICSASAPSSVAVTPSGISYASNGTNSIELKAFDTDGNFAVVSKSISIMPAPTVDFHSDNNCTGQDVLFFDDTTPGGTGQNIVDWSWQFDGLGNSVLQNPQFLFPIAADYNVQLDVVDNRGCTSNITKSVKVYSNLDIIADFNYDALVCTHGTEALTDASTFNEDIIMSWLWDFNNGEGTSTLQNPEFVFSTAGPNDVTLSVTGISGCEYPITKQINIIEGPLISFEVESSYCQDEVIMFEGTSNEPTTNYLWDFDDGTVQPGQTTEHTFAQSGMYNILLSADAVSGCVGTSTALVQIYSKPAPDFSLDLPPFSCSGSPSQFNDLTPNPVDSNLDSWSWSFGDPANGTSVVRNAQYIYALSGDYNVNLDVTTNFGCTASVQKLITILPSPVIDFTFNPACVNQATTFTPASTAGINSWQWKIGTATYNQQTPTHVFGSSNTFSAELTTIDNNGCVAVLSKQVSVPVPSIPNFNSANNCTQQNTIFTDLTPSGTDPVVSRAWQFGTLGTGTGPVASFMFPAAGSYPTKLTVTNESGCSYIISKNVSISNSPVPTFTATPQVGTVPLTVQLVNTSDNTVSQLWSVNDPQSSTSTDLSTQFSFSELGQYVVDLTVTNPEGCSATSSKIISVIVPSLDLELTSLSLNPSATGEINLLVSVKNNSNTPITNPKIAIDISGQVVVNETLNVVIQPTQTHTQVLTTGIIDAKGGMTYVCAELILDGDINNLNNKLCLNQESGTVVLDPYPNPGSEQMTIEWISESQGEVDIYIFDPVGRKVFDYSGSSFESGLNRIAIPLQGYNPGIYHVLFVSGSARKSFRYNVRR